ncbi:MAG TPA: hemerythrin domain-containing protein, partial [Blastocatellia bacterium]|nr:hemerythrin domain-containing protein [Blastocatellia bacterium]
HGTVVGDWLIVRLMAQEIPTEGLGLEQRGWAGTGSPTFLSLLNVHDHLTELFLSHQEALLVDDIELAVARLREYEAELSVHIRVEEEILLPVYQRAGTIPGGQPVFFSGEHKKMREFLSRFFKVLERPAPDVATRRRQIIALLDQQAMFKNLVEHHDQRERNILYPALDRVTTEAERLDLLAASSDPTSVR